MDYWKEAVEYALEDADIVATQEQIKTFCTACQSTGRITSVYGPLGRSTNTNCFECNGRGYLR